MAEKEPTFTLLHWTIKMTLELLFKGQTLCNVALTIPQRKTCYLGIIQFEWQHRKQHNGPHNVEHNASVYCPKLEANQWCDVSWSVLSCGCFIRASMILSCIVHICRNDTIGRSAYCLLKQAICTLKTINTKALPHSNQIHRSHEVHLE